MKQKNRLVLLLVLAIFALQSGAHADENKSDFFGIKKFVRKGIPANPPKKKVKGIPANASSSAGKSAQNIENDSELTEEEEKLVKEMAERAPKNKTDTADLPAKEKVPLPPSVLSSVVPKAPPAIPKAPASIPKNPNDHIIRIPKAPARVPKNPFGLTAQDPPTAPPGTKKKP